MDSGRKGCGTTILFNGQSTSAGLTDDKRQPHSTWCYRLGHNTLYHSKHWTKKPEQAVGTDYTTGNQLSRVGYIKSVTVGKEQQHDFVTQF